MMVLKGPPKVKKNLSFFFLKKRLLKEIFHAVVRSSVLKCAWFSKESMNKVRTQKFIILSLISQSFLRLHANMPNLVTIT